MQSTQPPVLPQSAQRQQSEWFYFLNGQQIGPVREDVLAQLITSGAVTVGTLVWCEGMAQWVAVESSRLALLLPQAISPTLTPRPVGSVAPMPGAMSAASGKRPWYFSRGTLILTFLFITPLWTLLILLDRRRQGIGTKILASLFGFAYLWFVGSAVFGAPASTVAGPGTIEFGASYESSSGDITITDQTDTFTAGDAFAWVARLSGPVNTTQVVNIYSRVDEGDAEIVVERVPMNIADPKFNILADQFRLPPLESGTYRLRIEAKDAILAEGTFTVKE